MDQAEYDRLYRRQGIIGGKVEDEDPTQAQSIVVDGQSVAPLRITVVNSSPQALYEREMLGLEGTVEVVGRTEGGVELVRRTGGADYAGNEQWRDLMRRFGRLK